jgi:hypothetical protein
MDVTSITFRTYFRKEGVTDVDKTIRIEIKMKKCGA